MFAARRHESGRDWRKIEFSYKGWDNISIKEWCLEGTPWRFDVMLHEPSILLLAADLNYNIFYWIMNHLFSFLILPSGLLFLLIIMFCRITGIMLNSVLDVSVFHYAFSHQKTFSQCLSWLCLVSFICVIYCVQNELAIIFCFDVEPGTKYLL